MKNILQTNINTLLLKASDKLSSNGWFSKYSLFLQRNLPVPHLHNEVHINPLILHVQAPLFSILKHWFLQLQLVAIIELFF